MDPKQNGQPQSDTESGADTDADSTTLTRDRVSLEDILREYAPPDQSWPALPGDLSTSGWEFRTVHHRTCPGRTGETALCPTTGEQLPVTEPHICLNARRDEFPETPGPTAEHKHFIFETPAQLRTWFERGSDEQIASG